MAGHDLIVIGASAGGVEALTQLAGQLRPTLPAAVLVVVHISPRHASRLPEILSRAGPLPASHAVDGQKPEPRHIYVARPDHHLLVGNDGALRVIRGPKENGHRPAVDPLFRTAAFVYGPRVVGVVLTGWGDCGSAGLLAIKQRGGLAVVQTPEAAAYPDMPRNARERVAVDHTVSLARLGALLNRLARKPAPPSLPPSPGMELENRVSRFDPQTVADDARAGTPSGYTCPDCGGVLWELREDQLRFRCRVGHAYTTEVLQSAQTENVEAALYSALRALEDKASLVRKLAVRERTAKRNLTASRYEQRATAAEQQALVLRELLLSGTKDEPSDPEQ